MTLSRMCTAGNSPQRPHSDTDNANACTLLHSVSRMYKTVYAPSLAYSPSVVMPVDIQSDRVILKHPKVNLGPLHGHRLT